MLANLLVGTIIIVTTFLFHTIGLVGLTKLLSRFHRRLGPGTLAADIPAMLLIVVGLFAIIMVEVTIWAAVFTYVGAIGDFNTALYFSTSNFATVGFGDVVPSHDWRLLAAIEGVGGFLLIGWSSAYLVTAGIRIGPFRRGVHF